MGVLWWISNILKLFTTEYSLQIVVLTPLIVILCYYFGFFLVWGTLIILLYFYSHKRVNQKRISILQQIINEKVNNDFVYVERCEWLNIIIQKFWFTSLQRKANIYQPQIKEFFREKFAHFGTLSIGDINVGKKSPIIESISLRPSTPESHVQFEANFYFQPDTKLTIFAHFLNSNLELSSILLRGKVLVDLQFNQLYPMKSTCTISIMEDPVLDFTLKTLNNTDLMSLPVTYDWVRSVALENLSKYAIWPHNITFNFEGEFIPPNYYNDPIIDIGLILVDEIVPAGWEVVDRTSTFQYSGDLNRSSSSKELYLCYKKANPDELVDTSPITGICVIFPDRNESPPPDFQIVKQTIGGQDADINQSFGEPVYLCYTRKQNTGGNITSISVFNKTMEHHCPSGFTQLSLTPNGFKANLNKQKKGADEIFFCFRGTYPSPFGYHRYWNNNQEGGLLSVQIIAGMNLKSTELGGVCDSFCEVFVSPNVIDPKDSQINTVYRTKTIEKSSFPVWDETFVLRSTSTDVLNVQIYDKKNGKEELIGVLKLALDTLVFDVEVKSWYELQLASHGRLLVAVKSLNFGLKESSQRGKPLHQLDANKAKKVRKFILVSDVAKAIKNTNKRRVSSTRDGTVSTDDDDISLTNSQQMGIYSPELSSPAVDSNNNYNNSNENDKKFDNEINFSDKKGSLEFKSENSKKKSFSKRFGSLREGQLLLYKSQKDKNPAVTIDLQNSQILQDESNVLAIKSANKKFLFKFPESEYDEWTKSLRTNTYLITQLENLD